MTTFMGVLARAGLLPAAATMLLIGSFAARAEDSPVPDKAGAPAVEQKESTAKDATAAKKKPDAEAQAASSTSAGSDNSADKKAAAKDAAPKDAAPKDATAAEKKPEADAQAASSTSAGSHNGADKEAAAKRAAPKDAAPKDAATAESKDAAPKDTAATKSNDAATKDAASKDAATADDKPEDTAAKAKAVPPAQAAAVGASAKSSGSETEKSPADSAKAGDKTVEEPTKKADAPEHGTSNTTTAALPDAAAVGPAAGVADKALPPADAIVASVRQMIPDLTKGSSADDVAALAAFYEELNGPAIWASTSGLTDKGKAVVKEIAKADDWGLPAADFKLPQLSEGTLTPEAAARAEIMVAKAILKYARYARGGRIDPDSISALIDVSPPLLPPKTVLNDISVRDQPDAYLRGLQPKHEQFERLRQVLLKLRGSNAKEEEPEEDAALSVKLPPGRLIKGGAQDPQIALLRKRLKVPADDPAKENVYDEKLQAAVRDFQRANGLRPDALIGNNTRAVLNGRPKPPSATNESKIERILVNMERWRWLPEDLGKLYVWDNVPEALTRIVKDGKIIHTDRIIVGQPSWPTPTFSAEMKTVVFHPSWGVPSGIKAKELAPLLRKSSGAGFFGIFGGGYSAQAVLDAYQLRAYINGRQVDANSIDWNSIDIRSVSFQQPPGPKNPLGKVKFMFPNKHDVYMHDTPERDLFSRSFRALSHGCMRVQDPHRFAEIILGQDKGWSPQKVESMFAGYSSTVPLDTQIPVHVTYMTARVDDNGKLLTFPDFYGLDGRTAAALTGRKVRFEQPVYGDDSVASSADPAPSYSPTPRRTRKKQYQSPPTLADAISNLFSP